MTIYVPEELKARLADAARAAGTTEADLVRTAVTWAIDQQEAEDDFARIIGDPSEWAVDTGPQPVVDPDGPAGDNGPGRFVFVAPVA